MARAGVIWLDTNILLRLLTADDPAEARRARSLLSAGARAEVRLAISPEVMAEAIWVLVAYYQVPREAAAQSLRELLAEARVSDGDGLIDDALALVVTRRVDPVDALLAARAVRDDDLVASFDADIRRLGARLAPF